VTVLSARERAIAAALGDALYPSVAPGDPPGSAIVPDALDAMLAAMPADKQRAVRILLTAFDVGAALGHGRRFVSLGHDARERYLAGWAESRLGVRKVIYRSLKGLCGAAYYQDRRTWPSIGYEGPLKERGVR
jgi:hypothetical protein